MARPLVHTVGATPHTQAACGWHRPLVQTVDANIYTQASSSHVLDEVQQLSCVQVQPSQALAARGAAPARCTAPWQLWGARLLHTNVRRCSWEVG